MARFPITSTFVDIVDKRGKLKYVITADIPGAGRDMVEVSVDQTACCTSWTERADRHEERGGSGEGGAKYVVYNRSLRRLQAQLSAAEDVGDGAVDATMKPACSPCVFPREGDHPA